MLRPSMALYLVGSLCLSSLVSAANLLSTSGFQDCGNGTQDVTVSQFQLSFDRATNELVFAVAGNSKVSQKVTAQINVTAFGQVRYSNSFDPCQYNITELCPIPSGPFFANGNISIPDQYVSQIPSIAFSLDGSATLQLIGDNGHEVSCITSAIENGETTSQSSVIFVTAGIAGAALIMSGIASLSSLSAAGAGNAPNSGSAHAPSFTDVMQWFQFIAFSGMYAVNYPPVYRDFSKNFAWSTGLVSWAGMQNAIDSFRARTGGNLTDMSYGYLKNSTLVYSATSSLRKRDLNFGVGGKSGPANSTQGGQSHVVSGVEAFSESLLIPSANTFMTVLLVFMMVLAVVAVAMLLFKLILELWALCGHLSKRFERIRSDYWLILSTTIVRIILIVYGVWALYCLWQFHSGDSWAASLLAAVTLGIFTAVLAFFTIRIFYLAYKAKKLEGGIDELYEHEPWMRKYGFFYDQFKSNFWWFFLPILLMGFIRACFIVFAGKNGLVQAVGILSAEGVFLVLLFWRRPYDGRMSNVVNAMIGVVRVLSIACILVFVDQLGISRTTQTITGVILIAIQSTLTVILAILIIVSAVTSCLHKRKPTRKYVGDEDLQPLGMPSGETSELEQYPTRTRSGYMSGSTLDQQDYHRASTIYKEPYSMSTPIYEEYTSNYSAGRDRPMSTNRASLGYGRKTSVGHDSEFHYSPIGSPPPVIGGRTR